VSPGSSGAGPGAAAGVSPGSSGAGIEAGPDSSTVTRDSKAGDGSSSVGLPSPTSRVQAGDAGPAFPTGPSTALAQGGASGAGVGGTWREAEGQGARGSWAQPGNAGPGGAVPVGTAQGRGWGRGLRVQRQPLGRT